MALEILALLKLPVGPLETSSVIIGGKLRKIVRHKVFNNSFTKIVTIVLLIYTIQGYSMQNHIEVDSTVVKLSYLGAQNKSVTSLLFSVNDVKDLADKFLAHKVLYKNDETLLMTLKTVTSEQKNIINTVKQLKSASTDSELSIVLLDTKKDTVSEYKLDRKEATQFYSDIFNIIKLNTNIIEAFTNWGNATRFKGDATL